MAKTLQLRRGTTAEITANTPAPGELFVDTEKKTVTVGDGTTAGGIILARDDRVSSAFNTANGANGLAASAFNTANSATSGLSAKQDTLVSGTNIKTVNGSSVLGSGNLVISGGGGGDTGDFTFSANTISLPDFTNGVLDVTGNVSTIVETIYAIDVNYGVTSTISKQGTDNNRVILYINTEEQIANIQDVRNSFIVGKPINATYLPSGGGDIQNFTATAITGVFYSDSGAGTPGVLTIITNSTETISISQSVSDNNGLLSVTAIDGDITPTDFSYTFSQTGEFISDSALIGDVLISDDIITPLAVDSYGLIDPTATGTLTVNGNLDVLNSLTVDGNTYPAIKSISLSNPYYNLSSILIGNNTTANSVPGTVAIGQGALARTIAGSTDSLDIGFHTAVGLEAGRAVTSSSENSFFGYYAGYSLTTGRWNTFIGSQSGQNLVTGNNVSCIGYATQASSSSASNEFNLGNNIQTLRCFTQTITSSSDARDKTDIATLNAGLDFVSKLKPVNFTWNSRDDSRVGVPDMGFIAQDLQQAQQDTGITVPGLVYESNPDKLEASYGKLIPILVKAIQDLQAEVEALKSK